MPKKGESSLFLTVKTKNLFDAYQILREKHRGATPLILWLRFASNRDGYEFALSPRAIEQETGIPESTCRDSIKALIEDGFLVPLREGSNVYNFYELPPASETPSATHSVSEIAHVNTIVSANIRDTTFFIFRSSFLSVDLYSEFVFTV